MKMKKLVALLICFFLFFPAIQRPSFARTYDYQFEDVYQKPWYERAAPIAVDVVSDIIAFYVPGGKVGEPLVKLFAKRVGNFLFGLRGAAATNAVLAALGGGAVAKGGLGIAGGVAVLNKIGDIVLDAAMDAARKKFPKTDTQPVYARIIPLPTNVGTSKNRRLVDEIEKIKSERSEAVFERIESRMNYLAAQTYPSNVSFVDNFSTVRFDILTTAIAAFNTGNFEKAKVYLNILMQTATDKESSFLDYFKAMLLISDENYKSAVEHLLFSITYDEKAIQPYLLLAMLAKDKYNIADAIDVLELAKKKIDGSYAIDSFYASLLFEQKNYQKAINLYKDALADTTINEYEAECKIFIASCYYLLNDRKQAYKWKDDALDEVADKKYKKAYITRIWEENIAQKSSDSDFLTLFLVPIFILFAYWIYARRRKRKMAKSSAR